MINKIFKSFWFKSGSITLLNRIFIACFGLLNFIFLVRILSSDDFGVWVIFLSLTTLSESIRNSFIYNPLLKYLNSENEENHKSIISASLVLNFLTAFFITIIFVILAFTINYLMDAPELKNMLLISIISVVAFTFLAHFNFLQQAKLKFTGTMVTTFVQKFILFAFILYASLTHYHLTLYELALMYSTAYIFSSAMAYWFARRENTFTLTFKRVWLYRLFHYGKYTFGTNLSALLNKSAKDWFLGGMIGTSAVAIFAPAVRISNLFQIPLGAIASIFYPEMISRVKNEGNTAAKYLYERSVALIMIFITPCVIAVFFLAEPLVMAIAGPDYPNAVPVLQVMIFAGCFEPFQRQFGVTLNAIGKAKINFYFVIVNSVMAIIITYFSIKLYGIMGAAYGMLVNYALAAVVVQYILYKQLNVNIWNIWKYGVEAIYQGYVIVITSFKAINFRNG